MKRLVAMAVIMGVVCAGAEAGGLGLFGSYWNPKDGNDAFGAGLKLRGGMGLFYAGLRGTYFNDITGSAGDVDVRAIPVDATIGLQFMPIPDLELYGGGGVSYYFLDANHGLEVDDEFGWLLEAGAELNIASGFGVFGEVLWRSINGTVKGSHFVVDSNDFSADGVGVNVGLIFH